MADPTTATTHEPMRRTLTRTVGIAVIVGGVLAWRRGDLARWPVATALVLWPVLGGHFVERWYLEVLRPRLPKSAGVRVAARLATWFVGGIVLGLGMALTAIALGGSRSVPWAWWWVAGLAFVAIEIVAHLLLRFRGRPSLLDGRG